MEWLSPLLVSLGVPPDQAQVPELLSGGANNRVFRAGPFVIKIPGSGGSNILTEGAAMKALACCSFSYLRVPKPVTFGSIDGEAFLILPFIDGNLCSQEWRSLTRAEQIGLWDRASRALRELHSSPLIPLSSIVSPFPLSRITKAYREALDRGALSEAYCPLLKAALQKGEAPLTDASQFVLTHGDFYLGNILRERVSQDIFVFDFDSVFLAPRQRDLVGFIHNALRVESGGHVRVREGALEEFTLLGTIYPELFSEPSTVDILQALFVERVIWCFQKAHELVSHSDRYRAMGDGLFEAIFNQKRILEDLLDAGRCMGRTG